MVKLTPAVVACYTVIAAITAYWIWHVLRHGHGPQSPSVIASGGPILLFILLVVGYILTKRQDKAANNE